MTENTGKKLTVYLPVIISLVLVIGIMTGIFINKRPRIAYNGIFLYPKSDKLNNVIKYIEEEYVDSISPNKLTEDAIIALLKELDPHSVYIPANEFKEVNESLEGNFSGIGVEFNMENDTAIVIMPVPKGPSAIMGIISGDRIIKVNDTIIAGVKMNSKLIVKKLKGPTGTKVKVGIKRPGRKNEIAFEITRDKIPLISVDAAYMIDKKIGYIKINQFSKNTKNEFLTAVKKLETEGMKSLILDLRDNGGGYLDVAIDIANQFLEKGKLIVYTKGKARPRQDYRASASGICQNNNLVVLIDELTASASEIFAGAIQDNDRGTIIGRRSFGKGLVQEQIVLSDGSAIRLTVSRYYTPTGRCIQKPYVNGIDDYLKDLNKRYAHGELENKDSIHFNDSLKFKTPKGKIVYGGGGIMPDIFVPLDTTGFNKLYFEIKDLSLVHKFAFYYSDSNRFKLKKIANLDDFRKYLESDKIYDKFISYIKKEGLKTDNSEPDIFKKIITVQVEAYIARNFFSDNGYYKINQEIDETLNKAIMTLSGK